MPALIDRYVRWHNAERPCYAIGYRMPDAFYEDHMAGRVERRDTFKSRVLDPTPKFVRERRRKSGSEGVSADAGPLRAQCPPRT